MPTHGIGEVHGDTATTLGTGIHGIGDRHAIGAMQALGIGTDGIGIRGTTAHHVTGAGTTRGTGIIRTIITAITAGMIRGMLRVGAGAAGRTPIRAEKVSEAPAVTEAARLHRSTGETLHGQRAFPQSQAGRQVRHRSGAAAL